MLPELIAAPFAILSAALPNTNITDIARVFNESSITTTGNFTFEPTILLFVNHPQSGGHREFDSLLLTAGTGNGTFNESSSISALIGSGGNSTENDEEYCDEDDLGEHSNAKNGTDKFLADLSSTSALQVSLNTTVSSSSIKEAPIFAVNGTYSESELFCVGIFHFLNSSSDTTRVHYFGGNFTAQSIFGGAISVLTNSTPALIEYVPPVDIDAEETTGSFVYLLFSQSSEFHYSEEWFSSSSHNQTISISMFIEETGLGSAIGGSMIWLSSDGNSTSSEGSSLSLEGSIPADVYTASASFWGVDDSSLSEGDASATGTAAESGDSDFFNPSGSNTGETAPSQTTTDDLSSGEPGLETDGSSLPVTSETDEIFTHPLATDTGALPSETDSGFPSESETGPLEPSESAGDFDEGENPVSSTGSGEGPLESGSDDLPTPSEPTDEFSEPGTGAGPVSPPTGSGSDDIPQTSGGEDTFPTASGGESGEAPSATGDDSDFEDLEPDSSTGPDAVPSETGDDFDFDDFDFEDVKPGSSTDLDAVPSATGDGSDSDDLEPDSSTGPDAVPSATGDDFDFEDLEPDSSTDLDEVPSATGSEESDDFDFDAFPTPSDGESGEVPSATAAAPSFTDGEFHSSFEGDSDHHNTGGASESDDSFETGTLDSSLASEGFNPTEFPNPSTTDEEPEIVLPTAPPTEYTQSDPFGGPESTGTSPDDEVSILPIDDTFSEPFGGPPSTGLEFPPDPSTDFPLIPTGEPGDPTESGGSHSSFEGDSDHHSTGGDSDFASTSTFDDSFGATDLDASSDFSNPTELPEPSVTDDADFEHSTDKHPDPDHYGDHHSGKPGDSYPTGKPMPSSPDDKDFEHSTDKYPGSDHYGDHHSGKWGDNYPTGEPMPTFTDDADFEHSTGKHPDSDHYEGYHSEKWGDKHPTGEPMPSETSGFEHDKDIPWCDEIEGDDNGFTASETATATEFRRWLRFDRGEFHPLF